MTPSAYELAYALLEPAFSCIENDILYFSPQLDRLPWPSVGPSKAPPRPPEGPVKAASRACPSSVQAPSRVCRRPVGLDVGHMDLGRPDADDTVGGFRNHLGCVRGPLYMEGYRAGLCRYPSCLGSIMPSAMERVVTYFNLADHAKLKEYAQRKKVSLYSLAKRAISEYVERHPSGKA